MFGREKKTQFNVLSPFDSLPLLQTLAILLITDILQSLICISDGILNSH